MRLTIFGAGYVGLVTGACLSDLGHDVIVYDIDQEKVAALREGVIPIYEPGLGEIVRRNLSSGRLCFVSDQEQATWGDAEVYFIAVGTPPAPDGSADLSAVMKVAETIRLVAARPALVVVKSTVPVGTCAKVQSAIDRGLISLEVVSNPEFLKEGDAVADFFKPDRVVVGAKSQAAREKMRELYAPLQLSGERPLIVTDPHSSELIKYASNTMLATRISFMNELSQLVHLAGGNIHDVRLGVGADSRIGKKFLYAGPGYGGSCFPKDVQALVALGRSHGLQMRVADAAHQANEDQATFLARLISDELGGVAGKRIAIWGLAFKPETDDVREAPSLKLSKRLLEEGASLIGHDPEASRNFRQATLGSVEIARREIDALEGAHAIVLLTEWRCYRAPDFREMRRRMASGANGKSPLVVDARNIWSPELVRGAGLRYQGIGVPRHDAA